MAKPKPDPFGPALQMMASAGLSVLEPASFQAYLQANGLPPTDTAPAISVDFLEKLAPSLRQAGVMVFRLGAVGRTTRFTLVGAPAVLHDFFLHDDEVLCSGKPERFEPEAPPGALEVYSYLGTLTETSMVNLAFASGLIGEALGLDRPYPTAAPATGSSTYDFSFRPHSQIDSVLEHVKGQVEIDAAFVGRREGRPHLFVIEAKSGTETRTLAKHKLVYPLLSLAAARHIPADLPIIPVYLRMVPSTGCVVYHVTECSFPDPRERLTALDELKPKRHRCLELRLG